MKFLSVNDALKNDFIEFCQKHSKINDDSFSPGMDFIPDEDHPSFVICNKQNEIIAASSLILERPYRLNKKGRFMIFYSIFDDFGIYKKMLIELIRSIDEINNLYLFTRQRPDREDFCEILEHLGFKIERYSFVLKRKDIFEINYELPNNLYFKNYDDSINDRENYCKIINKSFAHLEGHYDVIPSDLDRIFKHCNVPENGIVFLYKNSKPIGLVFTEIEANGDDKETLFIGPIAVIPNEQRKGYGTILLRKAIQIASNLNLVQSLSVNGKNEKAISLYLKEGFRKIETVICFNIDSTSMKKLLKEG